MEYPQGVIVKMINDLKIEKKISAKEIEDLLGYSNGMIGKIKKGRTKLPEDKISILGKFYFDKMNEGKQVGYMKILSNGSVETGIIEPNGERVVYDEKILAEIEENNKPENKAKIEGKINGVVNDTKKERKQPLATQECETDRPIRQAGESSLDFRYREAQWLEQQKK